MRAIRQIRITFAFMVHLRGFHTLLVNLKSLLLSSSHLYASPRYYTAERERGQTPGPKNHRSRHLEGALRKSLDERLTLFDDDGGKELKGNIGLEGTLLIGRVSFSNNMGAIVGDGTGAYTKQG
jgi:hypothetical protein